MNLLLEADRLDDILNEYSKASESMFADCLRDNDEGSRRTTRAKLKSEPTNDGTEAVVEGVDASFDGTTSTDGCTTLTDTSVSSVIVLDVGKLRGRHKLPETLREKRKLPEVTSMDSDTIDDGLGNSIDFTPDENNCQRRKTQHRANAYSQMSRGTMLCPMAGGQKIILLGLYNESNSKRSISYILCKTMDICNLQTIESNLLKLSILMVSNILFFAL